MNGTYGLLDDGCDFPVAEGEEVGGEKASPPGRTG